MRVVILDDQQQSREYCKLLLKRLANKYDEELTIVEYVSGTQMLRDLSIMTTDLMFIDIGLGEEDGIAVASALREAGYEKDIVFFTHKKDRAIDAFDVEALHYILKGKNSMERIDTVFSKAMDNYRKRNNDVIILQNSNGVVKIDIRSILYFEVKKRIVTVYYENKNFDFYSTLGKVEYMMRDKEFIRCHKSYAVSKNAVREVWKRKADLILILENGKEIPVGRVYRSEIENQFLNQQTFPGKAADL